MRSESETESEVELHQFFIRDREPEPHSNDADLQHWQLTNLFHAMGMPPYRSFTVEIDLFSEL
jgi:hypothetical protein